MIPTAEIILTLTRDPRQAQPFVVWWGDPLQVRCRVTAPMNFSEVGEAVLEIKNGGLTGSSQTALAYSTVTPVGEETELVFSLTNDQMAALPIHRNEGVYWMVVSLLRGGERQTFHGGSLTAVRHNSDLQPPPLPPDSWGASRAALQDEIDARLNANAVLLGNVVSLGEAVEALPTEEWITAALAPLARTSQLGSGVSPTQLATALAPLATAQQIVNLADIAATSATAGELAAAVAPLATTSQLGSAVAPLATAAQLGSAVAPLATAAQLGSAVAPLATAAQLGSAVAPLATAAQLGSAVAPLATTAQVADLLPLLALLGPPGLTISSAPLLLPQQAWVTEMPALFNDTSATVDFAGWGLTEIDADLVCMLVKWRNLNLSSGNLTAIDLSNNALSLNACTAILDHLAARLGTDSGVAPTTLDLSGGAMAPLNTRGGHATFLFGEISTFTQGAWLAIDGQAVWFDVDGSHDNPPAFSATMIQLNTLFDPTPTGIAEAVLGALNVLGLSVTGLDATVTVTLPNGSVPQPEPPHDGGGITLSNFTPGYIAPASLGQLLGAGWEVLIHSA